VLCVFLYVIPLAAYTSVTVIYKIEILCTLLQWNSYSINEHDLHKPAYLVPLILLNRAVLSHCVEGSFILINWKSSSFNYILIRKKTYFLYVH
jgi:hypothetical protein